MSNYTPGPWYVSVSRGHYGARAVCADAAGGTLATLSGGCQGIVDANAHLIAAAPDLLKACKYLVAAVPEPAMESNGFDEPPSYKTQADDEIAHALSDAREAIAKAESQ